MMVEKKRDPKPDDQERNVWAYSKFMEIIKSHPQIEGTIWLSSLMATCLGVCTYGKVSKMELLGFMNNFILHLNKEWDNYTF